MTSHTLPLFQRNKKIACYGNSKHRRYHKHPDINIIKKLVLFLHRTGRGSNLNIWHGTKSDVLETRPLESSNSIF